VTSRRLILIVGVILLVGGGAIVIAALASSGGGTTTVAFSPSPTATLPEVLPGVSELQRGDFEGARAQVNAHLEKNPDDSKAWYFLALTYEQQNDFPGAIGIYEKILENDPRDFEAYFHIGQLRLKQKDIKGAAESFDRSLQLNSDFTAARVALADAAGRLGDTDKAIKLYFETIDMRPMGVHLDTIRVALAKLLINVGQPDNAIIQLNKALAENADNAETSALLAKAESVKGTTTTTEPTTSTTAA
jgi:tetratricopeptide (TPR) repeat protein